MTIENKNSFGARPKQNSSDEKIVFITGYFNILHPGHLRLLRFGAECGDKLVVGVIAKAPENDGEYLSAKSRLEFVRVIDWVDEAFLIEGDVTQCISDIRPDIVVKGKEHQNKFNIEEEALQKYGGQLLFSSGETTFSSLDSLKREAEHITNSSIRHSESYIGRHGLSFAELKHAVDRMSDAKVCVIGESIVDQYIHCDALGMSQEDPTLVVTPIDEQLFIGGAAIVAAHAKLLGAEKVNFISITGQDQHAGFLKSELETHGVVSDLICDSSRPTILKQRYRADQKTLLRVNHLRQHEVSSNIRAEIIESAKEAISSSNLLIFSDFNYGVLSQSIINELISFAKNHNVKIVADCQCSSQTGKITKYVNVDFITPTEHEARTTLGNNHDGLVVIAEQLRQNCETPHVLLTLGKEGLLIQTEIENSGNFHTDRLAALNQVAKDTAGAGDCFLACSSMAYATGSSIWKAAYLGSLAAACQVSRLGNTPLSSESLLNELQHLHSS